MKKINEAVSPDSIEKLLGKDSPLRKYKDAQYVDKLEKMVKLLANKSTLSDEQFYQMMSSLSGQPAPMPSFKTLRGDIGLGDIEEVMTPNELQVVVSPFEAPIKGQLTGDVKNYVDLLKNMAMYLQKNPNKGPAQTKEYLKNYLDDLKTQQKGQVKATEPQQMPEPVPMSAQDANKYKQSSTEDLPDLTALARPYIEKEPDFAKRLGLPGVPPEGGQKKPPRRPAVKKPATTPTTTAAPKTTEKEPTKEPEKKSDPKKTEPEKQVASKPTKTKKEPEKKQEPPELPTMKKLARAARLVK